MSRLLKGFCNPQNEFQMLYVAIHENLKSVVDFYHSGIGDFKPSSTKGLAAGF
jgi:hypothetical protein